MEAEVYLAKAENSLKAANLCYDQGLYDDAVSRAYYSILRAAIALLVKLGYRPDTKRIHHWVQAVFPRECVNRRKIISKRLASFISDLQDERKAADYLPRYVSRKTVERALKKADEFLNNILEVFKNDQA